MKEIGQFIRESFPDNSSKVPKFELPNFLVRFFSLFDRQTASVIMDLGQKRVFDATSTKSTFNWTPRSAEDAVNATAGSLLKHGLLNK